MSSNPAAALTTGGRDPRLSLGFKLADDTVLDIQGSNGSGIRPQHRDHHDPTVTFEEYHHYALQTRAEEDEAAKLEPAGIDIWQILLPGKSKPGSQPPPTAAGTEKGKEKHEVVNLSIRENRTTITDQEWSNASRALRNASAGACFYLITTDILGPFGIGYAIGTMVSLAHGLSTIEGC